MCRGDGTFGPNDDVTGSGAAKMLLTALGCRSGLEGFTGANWAINVQAMANQIDLFDGLTINPDQAAQGDYVLVCNYDDTYVLEAAESISGTISAYVNNAGTPHLSQIKVDGTNCGWSQSENLAPDLLDRDDYPAARLEDLVDGSCTLYLDPHGNMVGLVEDEAAVGSCAVITGVNATGSKGFRSVEVKVLLSDGTTQHRQERGP